MSATESAGGPAPGVAMQKCRVCGLGYAPAKLVALVRKKSGMSEELAETCPACRRARFAEEAVKTLPPAGTAANGGAS